MKSTKNTTSTKLVYKLEIQQMVTKSTKVDIKISL